MATPKTDGDRLPKDATAEQAESWMHQQNRVVYENQQRIDKTAQELRQAVQEARKR